MTQAIISFNNSLSVPQAVLYFLLVGAVNAYVIQVAYAIWKKAPSPLRFRAKPWAALTFVLAMTAFISWYLSKV